MASKLSQVAEGYAVLVQTLADRWRARAETIAADVEDGGYGVEEARRDVAGCAFLVTESWFLVASEAVDAYAILTGRQHDPYDVDSEEFESALPGAALALEGPLSDGFKKDALPVDRVTLLPAQLEPGKRRFRLRVDAASCFGDTYTGRVIATAPGVDPQPIDVWIQIA